MVSKDEVCLTMDYFVSQFGISVEEDFLGAEAGVHADNSVEAEDRTGPHEVVGGVGSCRLLQVVDV